MTTVLERWDIGLWDSAHWDAQPFVDAETASVVITPQHATFIVTHHYRLVAETASVVITPQDARLIAPQHLVMIAETASVVITPQDVRLRVFESPFPYPQPGTITMGIPMYFVDRW